MTSGKYSARRKMQIYLCSDEKSSKVEEKGHDLARVKSGEEEGWGGVR